VTHTTTFTLVVQPSSGGPSAVFTISVQTPRGEVFAVGATLKFDGTASSSPTGTITTWSWNFGDGTPVQTLNTGQTTHIYTVNGTFVVTLTVTDQSGSSGSSSQTINVIPAPLIGTVSYLHNLFVKNGKLTQNVTVQVTNPNSYAILVNVQVTGTCDTVCFFSDQSGPVLVGAGQTVFISVLHTFSAFDQGQTSIGQITLTFTSNTSNMDTTTYTVAATETISFRIK